MAKKTQNDPSPSDTLKGVCINAVRHDGVLYQPDDLIEVPRAAMERLIDSEAVELVIDAPAALGGEVAGGVAVVGEQGGETLVPADNVPADGQNA